MALNLVANISGAPLDGPADCTLACDEGHLTAHKIVLCAHSRYLQDILSKFPNAEHPIIILTELNITDIKILVNYMYTGELVITNDGSPTNLLRAAQILKIDSLTDFDDDEDDEDEDNDVQDHGDQERNLSLERNQPRNRNRAPVQMDTQAAAVAEAMEDQDDDDEEEEEEDEDEQDENNQMLLDQDDRDHHLHHLQHLHNLNQHHHHHRNNNHHTSTNNIKNITTNSITNINLNDSNNNNKIRCHLCNIGLSDVKCLYRHVLTRHLPEKWGYKCEFCDREFSRDDHLMRHYTTKHKNMEFNREKIRETRRLNREMAKNFHDQISTIL